jgi:hypothetical protein
VIGSPLLPSAFHQNGGSLGGLGGYLSSSSRFTFVILSAFDRSVKGKTPEDKGRPPIMATAISYSEVNMNEMSFRFWDFIVQY